MSLAITDAPADELLSLNEAKRHLRVYSGDFDDEITSLIRAARDYCERWTQRTLRKAVTRTQKQSSWWPTGCGHWRDSWRANRQEGLYLPWPPLLTVESITYYDGNNDSQTLDADNYLVEFSTDGGGRITWAATATIPSIYDRADAITVTFTAGYADATAIPPVALQAMKTKLTELWASGSDNEIKAASSATDRLLSLVDWTGYA